MNVDTDRLRDLTLELVEVESPTGDTAEVARLYARRLEELGMEVELLDDVFPATPIVIGRLRGGEPGPTIVLNGHLDTVPIPHKQPRLDGDTIVGRGSADMKGALACAAETAAVVAQRGVSFPGELVIVAVGLHESPLGRGEDLTWLLNEGGFTADYAVVGELGGPTLPVAHVGCATFEITVRREGMATHELQTPAGTPHPLLVAARVIEALRARNEELTAVEHEWVGPESYFLGEVHGGDFYNRHPVECRLVGTRRWAPGNTLERAESEFESLLEPIAAASGCAIDLDLRLSRGAYRIDPDDKLVVALREAYRDVTGQELPLAGVRLVADGAMFHAAGIPTVYHGPMGTGAHGDVESIDVAELVRATNVYLALLERLWA
jgi:acetylornithine deacetylase/succinyl-diaminopimelate desuccinylase-like protein